MRRLLASIASILAFQASGQADVSGIYEGFMHLVDARERVIALAVNLVERTDPLDAEQTRPLNASVVVDEEGGPYLMNDATYSPKSFRLELGYRRGALEKDPTTFQLRGFLDKDGIYSGKVFSGFLGQIGTFRVTKTDKTTLRTRRKYDGVFEGVLRTTPDPTPLKIRLQPFAEQSFTPQTWEFTYSLGRMGYWQFDDIQYTFHSIAVDYLRQKIVMTQLGPDGSPRFFFEGWFSDDGKSLEATYHSALNGSAGVSFKRAAP